MHATMILLSFTLAGQIPVDSSSRLNVDEAVVMINRPVNVPAEEAGVLADLLVREGSLVNKDDPIGIQKANLAKIDEQLAKLELEIARLQSENDVDVRFARVALSVALADMDRYQAAIDRYPNSVTAAEMDRQKLVVERSRLSIEQADRDLEVAELTKQVREQGLRGAELHLGNRTIKSPSTGQVIEVFAYPGEWLNPGDPIVKVVQVNRLRVECQVDGSKYAAQQLLGHPVIFTTTLPPQGDAVQFEGKVIFVNPQLNPVSMKGSVWAEIDNPELRLRPGMVGKLTILLEEGGAQIQ